MIRFLGKARFLEREIKGFGLIGYGFLNTPETHSYGVSSDRSQILAYRCNSVKVFNWEEELVQELTA